MKLLSIAFALSLSGITWVESAQAAGPSKGAVGAPRAPTVELITMGPGPGLFARFGHAALRVRHLDGHDIVYNFGYTRFDNPALVWDFLGGAALFWAEASSWQTTVASYRDDDRSLFAQPLALSPSAATRLARLLERSVGPKSRYVYDHFDDNCSTRPRDLIDKVVGGAVRKALDRKATKQTFRDHVRVGFAGRIGVLIGIELIMGREVDSKITRWQASFLPAELRDAIQHVTVDGRALAGPPIVVYRRKSPSPTAGDPRAGLHVLWFAAMVLVLFGGMGTLQLRRGRRSVGFSVLLLALVLGLLALIPWALLFLTKLPDLWKNELTALFWPTDLLLLGFGVRLLRGRFYAGRLLRGYLRIRLGVVGVALVAQLPGWFRQPLVWTVLAAICLGLLWMIVSPLPQQRQVEPTDCDEGAPTETADADPTA
jgi:hypothetical protein